MNATTIRLRLTDAEARQLDDARISLRLSRTDLLRLALDDLYRGPRFKRRPLKAIAA